MKGSKMAYLIPLVGGIVLVTDLSGFAPSEPAIREGVTRQLAMACYKNPRQPLPGCDFCSGECMSGDVCCDYVSPPRRRSSPEVQSPQNPRASSARKAGRVTLPSPEPCTQSRRQSRRSLA